MYFKHSIHRPLVSQEGSIGLALTIDGDWSLLASLRRLGLSVFVVLRDS